jgi:D-glycerate 3-kinase
MANDAKQAKSPPIMMSRRLAAATARMPSRKCREAENNADGRPSPMMRAANCLAYAARGPLFAQLKPQSPAAGEWARHGGQLAAKLCGAGTAVDSPEQLGEASATRIFNLTLPIYFWCRAFVRARRAADPHRAVGIGLSAPQGCGKTTLVKTLVERFAADGLCCATASIDDFYLPRAQQQALADAHPGNRLLQVRGNAGTHDLNLGIDTLSALLDRRANVPIPQYDKSAFNWRGDRAPREEWHVQTDPLDVVLFEGRLLRCGHRRQRARGET